MSKRKKLSRRYLVGQALGAREDTINILLEQERMDRVDNAEMYRRRTELQDRQFRLKQEVIGELKALAPQAVALGQAYVGAMKSPPPPPGFPDNPPDRSEHEPLP